MSKRSPFAKLSFSPYLKNNRFFQGETNTMDQCTHEVRAEYWRRINYSLNQIRKLRFRNASTQGLPYTNMCLLKEWMNGD